jgi:hypothetical protein
MVALKPLLLEKMVEHEGGEADRQWGGLTSV